jgi:glycosyltransferase involved in cell wall biosynthesis
MAQARKILILVENLPVPLDRRVWMEATTLEEAGYQVSVICPKGKYTAFHEVIQNISIYRYPLPSLESVLGHFLEYAIALPVTFILTFVVFFRNGFDVIQSANPPDFFFIIGGFFKIFGKKYIFDHHDLMPEICDSRWKGWKHKVAYHLSVWAEKQTFKTSDWVIATNESYRQVAIQRGGVRPDKVVIVRSGPKIENFKPVPVNHSWRSGKDYLVGYLGVMGPNDGIEYLLEAIDYIVHLLNRTDIHFILIGSGDLQPKLKKICTRLRLDEFVEFTGRIPDQEVKEILSTADIAVAPDPRDPLNDVSTMNKIIEYMALEKALVCFDLVEAKVSAGDAAIYAKPNDAQDFALKIIELLEQPEKRKEMARYGRKRFLDSLAWDHQKKHLLRLYQEVEGQAGEQAQLPN